MIPTDLCSSVDACLYNYQTAFSGLLAVLAAAATAYLVWRGASAPIAEAHRQEARREKRQRQFIVLILRNDFEVLANRARSVHGSIRTQIAADKAVTDDNRHRFYLTVPELINDWDFMALVPRELFANIQELRRRVLDHNYHMSIVGGPFGGEEFRQYILNETAAIGALARRLSSEIGEVETPESQTRE